MAAIPSVLFTTGCKTVVRENIISSINTGIGVTLAENPKTELYEVKVGYIRSQFYSVPTGKNVEDESAGGTHLSNEANITPEIVSGIRMESDARHLLLGVSVSESFAVGKIAVMSPAATAMYIADARNKNNATAAGAAAKQVSDSSAKYAAAASSAIAVSDERIEKIIGYASDPAKTDHLDSVKVKALVAGTALVANEQKIAEMTPAQFKEKLQRSWEPFVGKLYKNVP